MGIEQLSTRRGVKKRRRSCLGCFGRLLLAMVMLALAVPTVIMLSLLLFPPFGGDTVARVLLVGLDEAEKPGAPRRSDTIILVASRLDVGSTTLISVPRDAYVRFPGRYRGGKINAAFPIGGIGLLQQTLADPDIMDADLPDYLVIDSSTVKAIVDALGGIEVNVTRRMDYDDNWGKLHIHLKPGRQRLNGEQAVGYLRWRKNKQGGGNSDDFARGDRQREVLIAIGKEVRTWHGMLRLPAVYNAFREHSISNLNLRQMLLLGWAARTTQSYAVPAGTGMSRGVSYVYCDWARGRALWRNAQ